MLTLKTGPVQVLLRACESGLAPELDSGDDDGPEGATDHASVLE